MHSCQHIRVSPRAQELKEQRARQPLSLGGGGAIKISQNTLSCLGSAGWRSGGERLASVSLCYAWERPSHCPRPPCKAATGLGFKLRCPDHSVFSVSTLRHHSTNIYMPPGLRARESSGDRGRSHGGRGRKETQMRSWSGPQGATSVARVGGVRL